MAVRFLDSCDHYTDPAKKYTSKGSVGVSVVAGAGRRGTSALNFSSSTTYPYVEIAFPDDQPTWIIGGAFKIARLPSFQVNIITTADSGFGVYQLQLQFDGTLSLYNPSLLAQSTFSITTGSYHFIEWKIESTGSPDYLIHLIVQVDGVEWLNVDDTGTNQSNTVRFSGSPWSVLDVVNWDDIHILDGTGTTDNDFWGDTPIGVSPPTGDGSILQWTPWPAGFGDHYPNVDDPTVDLSNYIDTNTPGDLDTFTFVSPVPAGGIVKAVQQTIWAETGSGTANLQGEITTSGSQYYSPSLPINTTDKAVMAIWPTNPATSAPWTSSEINASEFGVTLV